MAEDTKENVDSKAVLTAEKVVPVIVQYVANALAVSALKDASALATIDQVLIEEAAAASTETITAAVVVQVEALEQAEALQVGTAKQKQVVATLKADLAVPEKPAEVSRRRLILETKEHDERSKDGMDYGSIERHWRGIGFSLQRKRLPYHY